MASDPTGDDTQTLDTYLPETDTETVTRCIVLPLETNATKNDYLRECIDEWQSFARVVAERLVSFQPYDWDRNNPNVYNIIKEQPDRHIAAAVAQEAAYKAVEAFQSWRENGRTGAPPIGEFGEGNYLRLRHQQINIESNDRGHGVKLSLVPYDPIWFHIDTHTYHEDWLDSVLDDTEPTRYGSAELYLHDDEAAALHLTVVTEVEVVIPDDAERWIGVDLGENVLYAAARVGETTGTVEDVTVESGREYRHHRERLKEKRYRLSQQGDLRGVHQCKGEIEKYTEWMLHTASNRIIDMATERESCGIRLENLTGYRESADDPIDDWPYAEFQEMICYKATTAGIPVTFVDPAGTSRECNRCGQEGVREGSGFTCRRCDYEVHADVNAAINIANGT